MAQVVHSPVRLAAPSGYQTVFLAGSISSATPGVLADDWQAKVVEQLSDQSVLFFNPRRIRWDPTWE